MVTTAFCANAMPVDRAIAAAATIFNFINIRTPGKKNRELISTTRTLAQVTGTGHEACT
jgi:hypothetical protein